MTDAENTYSFIKKYKISLLSLRFQFLDRRRPKFSSTSQCYKKLYMYGLNYYSWQKIIKPALNLLQHAAEI